MKLVLFVIGQADIAISTPWVVKYDTNILALIDTGTSIGSQMMMMKVITGAVASRYVDGRDVAALG